MYFAFHLVVNITLSTQEWRSVVNNLRYFNLPRNICPSQLHGEQKLRIQKIISRLGRRKIPRNNRSDIAKTIKIIRKNCSDKLPEDLISIPIDDSVWRLIKT